MTSRSDFLDAGYLPSEISNSPSQYGNIVPTPAYLIARRIAELRKMKDTTTDLAKSELFQRFLSLQQNPEALFNASAPMPTTPFGSMSDFAAQ
jgi:hypothetical protein